MTTKIDQPVVEYDGDTWCFFDDDLWKHDKDVGMWVAVEVWPDVFDVLDGNLVVDGCVIEPDVRKCSCPLPSLMLRGCSCGGV